jgi:hypothetical protein
MEGLVHQSPLWDLSGANWANYPPNQRFAIYGVGTGNPDDDVVHDKETGLVWVRSPAAEKKIWDAAIVSAYTSAGGGRRGWRLPTIEELLSLVDPAHLNPTLPQGHPFRHVQLSDFYWSCTLGMTSLPTYAWGYNFGNGDVSNVAKSTECFVWLVRGRNGHDYPV